MAPRNTGDPLWRSAAVRSVLLWLATALIGAVAKVAWDDHERGTANTATLVLISQQVADLRNAVDALRSQPVAFRTLSHPSTPPQVSP
jgi:hypothetical protein